MLKGMFEYIIGKTQPLVTSVDGRSYHVGQDGVATRVPGKDSEPTSLSLRGLSSLVDYVKAGADGYVSKGGLLAVIESYAKVKLFGPMYGDFKQRDLLAVVQHEGIEHHFGQHLSQEEFIVWLNTGFMPTDHSKALLQVVSSLRDESMSESIDDGISQTVAAKVGTARLANVTIPNPINLVPIRTFFEIEQVETPFLLRIKGKNDLRLKTADGGVWALTAVGRIKAYLEENMPKEGVTVLS